MRKNDIGAILLIAALYAAMMALGITCPIRFLTGISCAGCGMTRAWISLLRLDLSAAVSFHPLFWLPIPAAALFLLRRRIPKRIVNTAMWVMIALFLAVYVLRLISSEDTVAVFSPKEGLIWRMASGLFHEASGSP